MTAPVSPVPLPDSTTAAGLSEQAIQWIAKNEYFAFLGEKKIRALAAATDLVESTYGLGIFNEGRWMTPAFRKAMLQVLSDDLQQISETYAWMVVRRYRELKRFFKEKAELEEKKKRDDEAKAKLAAEKAAKAAAAKAKAAAPAAAPTAPAGTDGALHTPPQKDPTGSDPKKDGPGPG